MATRNVTLRPARLEDADAIADIFNYYIQHTVINFKTRPDSTQHIRSLLGTIRAQGNTAVVAESESGKILGYCWAVNFQDTHGGYLPTVEMSLACGKENVRRGVGKQLLRKFLSIVKDPQADCNREYFKTDRAVPVKNVIAKMAVDVDGPGGGYALRDWYMANGFTVAGELKSVGFKFGRWIDVLIMQLQL